MSRFDTLLGSGDRLAAAVAADAELAAVLPPSPVTIGIAAASAAPGCAPRGIAISVSPDGVRPAPLADADVVLRAHVEDWDEFLAARPRPPHHHFLAMRMRLAGTEVVGSELVFAQHAHVARRIGELARELVSGGRELATGTRLRRSALRGSYIEASIGGQSVDLFVEEAGDATLPALLVLHTAGADSRQAHALMTDRGLLSTHRVVAFDLPGHGKSDTLDGALGSWSLTEAGYTDAILGVIDALRLDRPILLGASMAGEACLATALRAPERLGGVIACEAAEFVPGRVTPWPRDPRVNAMLFTPEWIDGLIGPEAPARRRAEIKLQYAQGGFGTFTGDIDFYSGGWNGRDRVGGIDTSVCPVVMMTGEYDYSCTPAMSAATAAQIPGAAFWEMPGLGHFPITEHPERFTQQLRRALDEIERRQRV